MKKQFDIEPLKGMFPFILGTTSYIIPDDIIPNIQFIAPLLDCVQLLIFESQNPPSQAVITRINKIGNANNLKYVIHMPVDISLSDSSEHQRQNAVVKHLEIISLTEPLQPFVYIMHVHDNRNDHQTAPSCRDISKWQETISRSIAEILSSGIEPRRICIENLLYPLDLLEEIITHYDLSICLDTGHIVMAGASIKDCFNRFFSRTSVLHVHGVSNNQDHLDISHMDTTTLSMIMSEIQKDRSRERALIIEVFDRVKLAQSMTIMRDYL